MINSSKMLRQAFEQPSCSQDPGAMSQTSSTLPPPPILDPRHVRIGLLCVCVVLDKAVSAISVCSIGCMGV